MSLNIKPYNSKCNIVYGETKPFQDILRRHGALYLKGQGWLISKVGSINVLNALQKPIQPIKATEDFIYICKDPETFYLSSSYEEENLLNNDGTWNSVERYLMFKKYAGSFKAEEIKNANTLFDAKKIYTTRIIPFATTSKQLLLNKRITKLVNSSINPSYDASTLLYSATKEKFEKNEKLKEMLLNTGNAYIINDCYDDIGYAGNELGNTLMDIRQEFGGPQTEQIKTDHLVIEPYDNDRAVIRGDATQQILNKLPTKKNTNEWYIPKDQIDIYKEILYQTYPDNVKLSIEMADWRVELVKEILEMAEALMRLYRQRIVCIEDITFILNSIHSFKVDSSEAYPTQEFIERLNNIAHKLNITITQQVIDILWIWTNSVIGDESQYKSLSDIATKKDTIDENILKIVVEPKFELNEHEWLFLISFIKIFNLLKSKRTNTTNICITALNIITGIDYFTIIRDIYSERSQLVRKRKKSFIWTLKKTFKIKTPHISTIIKLLPKELNKKCILLFFISLDYISSLSNTEIVNVVKRMIQFSTIDKYDILLRELENKLNPKSTPDTNSDEQEQTDESLEKELIQNDATKQPEKNEEQKKADKQPEKKVKKKSEKTSKKDINIFEKHKTNAYDDL